jgi:hypothetical protein
LDGSCQTSSTGTFAGRIDGDRRDLFNEFEQLRFSCSGVTKQEDVDVSTQAHSVWKDLLGATEQKASNRLFDIYGLGEREGYVR